VFGEMLTFRGLAGAHHRPPERKAMLAGKVEDMINTVVRQIAFYEFERRVHDRPPGRRTDVRATGRALDRRAVGKPWSGGEPSEGYETFWAYIPHFIHSPFYVYAYAFGDCLVNSLYSVYEEHPGGFRERISRCSRRAAPSITRNFSLRSDLMPRIPVSGTRVFR
jgi:oligoendopeptidase F